MRNVVCLVGLPASGKSTFSLKLSNLLNYDVIEMDKYFESDFKAEKSCRHVVFGEILTKLNEKNSGVIIDDLGHLRSLRHFWFRFSTHFENISIIYIWLNTDQLECRRRNKNRKIPVSDASFDKICATFEPPGGEYFEQNTFEIKNIETFDYENFVKNALPKLRQKIEMKIQEKNTEVQSDRHLCDQILRKEIGAILRTFDGSKKEIVKKLNLIKREMLAENDISSETVVSIFRSRANVPNI